MPVVLANNVTATLATSISASDTGIALSTGDGALFPALSAGEYFYATLVSTQGTREIVKVTARIGDSLTVVRAQEGTTAQSFAAGSKIELRVTAASVVDAARDAVNALAIYQGTGSPEGVVTASVGALYLRSDGGTGTTLYVKESGTGNTGWAAK